METPQEYTKRMVGNVGSQNPLRVQASTAKKLARLTKGHAPSKLFHKSSLVKTFTPSPESQGTARSRA